MHACTHTGVHKTRTDTLLETNMNSPACNHRKCFIILASYWVWTDGQKQPLLFKEHLCLDSQFQHYTNWSYYLMSDGETSTPCLQEVATDIPQKMLGVHLTP